MAKRKLNWFKNVETIEELKKQFKKLVFAHHPDRCKDENATADMQEINSEYDYLFKKVKDCCEYFDKKKKETVRYTRKNPTREVPDDFRNIIYALLGLKGITVELCGRWVWIGGNTKENREALKALGCHYDGKKSMWNWYHPDDGINFYKKRTSHSMDYVRNAWGSTTYEKDDKPLLTA